MAAVREFVTIIAMALVLSFIVKTWFVQAFYIPSGSMEDTLVQGDRVVVSKLTPGPVDLKRGDVIVFEDPGDWLPVSQPVDRGPVGTAVHDALVFVGLLPTDSQDHLIKRVIGLPGDHVVCCTDEHRLTVNGTPITETYVKAGDEASSRAFDIVVPEGRLWVMGDHRSDSEDSRYHDPEGDGQGGSVPIDRVTGRAVALVWPFDRLGLLGVPDSVFATVPAPSPAPAAGSADTSASGS